MVVSCALRLEQIRTIQGGPTSTAKLCGKQAGRACRNRLPEGSFLHCGSSPAAPVACHRRTRPSAIHEDVKSYGKMLLSAPPRRRPVKSRGFLMNMDDSPERRSWSAIAATAAAGTLAVLLACALAGVATGGASPPLLYTAAVGVSIVAVAGLSNILVCWRAGYAVGRRYEELLLVVGSREETNALAEDLVGQLITGRRRWRVDRAAGKANGNATGAPVALQSLDWGKNHRNVERARNILERVTGRPARPA